MTCVVTKLSSYDSPVFSFDAAAYDINNAGNICGNDSSYYPNNKAVRWDNSGVDVAGNEIVFDSSGTITVEARSINEAGICAGFEYASSSPRALRWGLDGTKTVLGDVFGGQQLSYAYGINNFNIVVGEAQNTPINYAHKAVRWEADGTGSLFDQLSVGVGRYSRANAINDAGIAAGFSQDASGRYRAVTWNADKTIRHQLEDANVGGSSEALGINSAGETCGYIFDTVGGYYAAARWDANANFVTLGIVDGQSYGQASAINDNGVTAGYVDSTLFLTNRAFWWDAAGNASELCEIGDFFASEAYGINNAGVIVGLEAGGPIDTWAVRWDFIPGIPPTELIAGWISPRGTKHLNNISTTKSAGVVI